MQPGGYRRQEWHLCGLDMTATTAMPDAVRTGFAFSLQDAWLSGSQQTSRTDRARTVAPETPCAPLERLR